MGLKSKVRLVAAKSSALRINLNIQGCSVVAPSLHALSRSPSPPPSFTQYPSFPRSLVRDGQTSPHRPQLVVSRSTCPLLFIPPTREQLCNRYCNNKHTRFASSFSTGQPRDHGALQCHWTAFATKPIGQCVPVQTRCILHGPEEQSRTRGG